MGQYMMNVVGAAILAGLADQLLPEKGKARAYVRFLGGLCLLLVMVAPLGKVLSSLPSLFESGMTALEEASVEAGEYDKILEGTVKEAVRMELAKALSQKLEKDFGVNADAVEIGISFEEGDPLRLKRVLITLTGKDIFRNPYNIEEALSSLLGCECVVVIG